MEASNTWIFFRGELSPSLENYMGLLSTKSYENVTKSPFRTANFVQSENSCLLLLDEESNTEGVPLLSDNRAESMRMIIHVSWKSRDSHSACQGPASARLRSALGRWNPVEQTGLWIYSCFRIYRLEPFNRVLPNQPTIQDSRISVQTSLQTVRSFLPRISDTKLIRSKI